MAFLCADGEALRKLAFCRQQGSGLQLAAKIKSSK
jgi:hypothetical protein